MKPQTLAVLSLAMMETACSMFSGLAGSKSELACKAPDGVICTSVSGIYANSLADALPGQQVKAHEKTVLAGDAPTASTTAATATTTALAAGYFSPRDLTTPTSGDPIRMAPLVLRVWIAPWEDTDGDLHDQHYLYTVVNQGKWLLEANQQVIGDAYKPVFPLKGKEKPEPEEEHSDAGTVIPGAAVQGSAQGEAKP